MASFGQATTVSAKTISATNTFYIRSLRVDSISGDATFTNSGANVLVTQAAVKGYVSPIKARADSLANGLFIDSFAFQYKGAIRNIYSTTNGKTIIDKGWSTGDAYIRTQNDSSNAMFLKRLITPGSCTNCSVTFDSTGRATAISSGSNTGSGVAKKTLNIQNSNYILLGADTSSYITVSNSVNDTIYVPDDGTVGMAAPVNLDIYQMGTGKVVFLPLNGSVTVNAEFGKNRTGQQYAKATLNKLSANNWLLSGQLDTANVPYLTTSLSTLPTLTTNSGTASVADSLLLNGFFLTAGASIVASDANWQISLDNSTWTSYPSTISISTSGTSLAGQPIKVYERIIASASSGSIAGNIKFSSTGANTLNIPISGTVNTTTLQAFFNFATTRTLATGSQPFYGDPTTSPSFADTVGGTLWSITAVGANWIKYGGFYGGSGNGATSASSDGVFTQAMGASNYYTQTAFSTSSPNYNLIIGNRGELPAGTYQITIWGCIPYNTFNMGGTSEYWLKFGTSSPAVALCSSNGTTPGAGTQNLNTNGPGTTNVFSGTFTGTITNGQTISIGVSKGTGSANTPQTGGSASLGIINCILIKKIS